MVFLLYKHTNAGVFDGFLKISHHFPKISEDFIDIFTSEDTENTPLDSRMKFRMNFTSGVFSSKTLVST